MISSFLHLGFVAKYLSDAIIGGLSIGAVFHVIISQVKALLGIKLKPVTIPFILIGVGFYYLFLIFDFNKLN